jgi:8-oxo-dGTP pyrophosphatase MutT (NUDIX family)
MRRPDLVDVWIFRLTGSAVKPGVEVLMLHRSPHRILPGLWQGVSGLVERDETIAAAALREVAEETGLAGSAIEAFFHLDYVAEFLWEESDSLMASAYFALRVGPDWQPVLSHEHDEHRWLPIEEAIALAVWPAYREALVRIRDNLLDAGRAPWFEVALSEATQLID